MLKQLHILVAFGTGLIGLQLDTFVLAQRDQPTAPNILWITVEDMSPTLGCYGDAFARTPNVDRLAQESTRYTNAFASSPVCSPSRSCLINGIRATSTGTHHMRSSFNLPDGMQGFPAKLRAAGYFTSNNVKTDYNTGSEQRLIESAWDAQSPTADWRGRAKNQPFFSVINLMTTHQSRTMVWPYQQFVDEVQTQLSDDQSHEADEVPLPPYYPDTPLVRKTQARFYDCVQVMDQQVGEILARLEADGLANNTIVFFYSDHGSGMPRHKRALLDSGMKIPLLIRFPESLQSVAPTQPGETTDRLVTFEDFGPTVLSLTGLQPSPDMLGQPFLGEHAAKPREFVFGHRDRVDEILDMARSIRDAQFLYVRNFMPHLGYNQQSAWIDQGEIRRDFYTAADSDQLTPAQAHFLSPTRAVEELYDCQSDPFNLTNLADDPERKATLTRMRAQLKKEMLESRDLGLIPELELMQLTKNMTPWQLSRHTDQLDLSTLFEAADLVGQNQSEAVSQLLGSENASERYWGMVALTARLNLSRSQHEALQTGLKDPSVAVRIQAADGLARHGSADEALPVLVALLSHENLTVILHAARTIELMGDNAASVRNDIQKLFDRFEDEPGDAAWFIRFTATGFLSRVTDRP